jgi:hypothetical protein
MNTTSPNAILGEATERTLKRALDGLAWLADLAPGPRGRQDIERRLLAGVAVCDAAGEFRRRYTRELPAPECIISVQ